jgi:hypothetical protein
LAKQVPLFEELTQLAATLVKAKDKTKSKSRSRLSHRFSFASNVVHSQTSLASPKSPTPRKDNVRKDPPPEPEKEARPEVRVIVERTAVVIKDESVPDMSEVLCSDFSVTAKSFGKWRRGN